MVDILLTTYNGEKYLKEQLDSLFKQTYDNLHIICRDDGSSDNSLKILELSNVKVLESKENLGVQQSFNYLLKYAVQSSNSDYFMFCDQDDVWEKDKVKNTLMKMQAVEKENPNKPVLVHTNLKVVNRNLKIIHQSFMAYQGLGASYKTLNRLLMQNNITGCTMLINRKLAELCLPISHESIMHDWWIGLIASEFGEISYLDETTISYRQHSSNTEGAKKFNFKYIISKIYKSDLLSKNIEQAKAFLDRYEDSLSNESKQMLEDFSTIESKSLWQRRKILIKYKLLKQGLMRNIGLFFKI